MRPKGVINRIYRNGNYVANGCRWRMSFKLTILNAKTTSEHVVGEGNCPKHEWRKALFI